MSYSAAGLERQKLETAQTQCFIKEGLGAVEKYFSIFSNPFSLMTMSRIFIESPAMLPIAQIACSCISCISLSIKATIFFLIPPLCTIDCV